MQLLAMKFFQSSSYFYTFRANTAISILFSNNLNLCFLVRVRDQVSHVLKTKQMNSCSVVYIELQEFELKIGRQDDYLLNGGKNFLNLIFSH